MSNNRNNSNNGNNSNKTEYQTAKKDIKYQDNNSF